MYIQYKSIMSKAKKTKQGAVVKETKVELTKKSPIIEIEEKPVVKKTKASNKVIVEIVPVKATPTPKKKNLNWFRRFLKWIW